MNPNVPSYSILPLSVALNKKYNNNKQKTLALSLTVSLTLTTDWIRFLGLFPYESL